MGKKRRWAGIVAIILAVVLSASPMSALAAGGNNVTLSGADGGDFAKPNSALGGGSNTVDSSDKADKADSNPDKPGEAAGSPNRQRETEASGPYKTDEADDSLGNSATDKSDTASVSGNSLDVVSDSGSSLQRSVRTTGAADTMTEKVMQFDPEKYYIIYDAYDENGNALDANSSDSRVMFDNGGNNVGWLKYGSSWNRGYYSKYLWKFTEAGDGTYYMRSQGSTTAFGVLSSQAGAVAGGAGAANFAVSDKNVKNPGSPMKFVVMAQEGNKTYVTIQSAAYTDDRYGESNQVRYMSTEDVAMNATLNESQNSVRSYVTWVDSVDKTDRKAGWWVIEEIGYTIPGGLKGSTRLFHTKPLEVHYRIPAITTTNKGDVLVLADYRYDSQVDIGTNWSGWNGTDWGGFSQIGHRIDQVSRISTDNGNTWEPERNLTSQWTYPGEPSVRLSNGYGDPALVADRDSDNVLLLTVGGSYGFMQQETGAVSMLSTDGGRNFGEPVALGGRTTGTGTTTEVSNKGLYALDDTESYTWWSMFITSGRITQSRYIKIGDYYRIYCVPVVKVNSSNGANKNWVLYSDDFGVTWKVLPGPAISSVAADEAKVDELPNGNVVVTSRRTGGGRTVNIFTYDTTDPTRSTGSWGTEANLSIGHSTHPTNGELYILYAKDNHTGEYGWLALQSFPAYNSTSSGRREVRVFYKWLNPNTLTPAEFAAGWTKDNSFVLQQNWSGYSVITLQADGNLGLAWEENENYYDIVYQSVSVSELTQNKYSSAFGSGIGSKDTPYVVSTEDEAKAVLSTYSKEGVHWRFEGAALNYVTSEISRSELEAVRGEIP